MSCTQLHQRASAVSAILIIALGLLAPGATISAEPDDTRAKVREQSQQALVAVNYRLSKVDLTLGYRYIDWDFDKFGPFNDINLSGAFAGIKIPF